MTNISIMSVKFSRQDRILMLKVWNVSQAMHDGIGHNRSPPTDCRKAATVGTREPK